MPNSSDDNESRRSIRLPLLKVLMSSGLGSRRYLAQLIMGNKVRVDGKTVENLSHPVDPAINTITISGQKITVQPIHKIVLMLNKPQGTLSTTSDDKGRKTVIDILPPQYKSKGLYPVGRLDKDSTGLLLITNDGDLTYLLTHPKFEHEKEYIVSVKDRLLNEEIKKLEKGIKIEDELTYPSRIKEVKTGPPYDYSIIIHEGRKNQIRLMFVSIGHPVLALKRIRMGGLELGQLKEGMTRVLSDLDIKRLQQKNK